MQVASYIHKAIEAVQADRSGFIAPLAEATETDKADLLQEYRGRSKQYHLSLLSAMRQSPVICIGEDLARELRANISRCNTENLVLAALDNASFRLPLSPMVLEYKRKGEHFILHMLEVPEAQSRSGYDIRCTLLVYMHQGTELDGTIQKDRTGFVSVPFAIYNIGVEADSNFRIAYTLDTTVREDLVEKIAQADGKICISAILLAVFGLRTKGMSRDAVPVAKLNKTRLASGKTAIADHVVIKLTHYENKEGQRIKVSGRTVRLHWRRPHWRHIRFGPGKTQKRLERIEAVWVNYQPDIELPSKPKTYVVKR